MSRSRKLGLRLPSILVVAAAALAMGGCAGTTTNTRTVALNAETPASWGPTIMHLAPGPSGDGINTGLSTTH